MVRLFLLHVYLCKKIRKSSFWSVGVSYRATARPATARVKRHRIDSIDLSLAWALRGSARSSGRTPSCIPSPFACESCRRVCALRSDSGGETHMPLMHHSLDLCMRRIAHADLAVGDSAVPCLHSSPLHSSPLLTCDRCSAAASSERRSGAVASSAASARCNYGRLQTAHQQRQQLQLRLAEC